jgi:nucleoside-diphosphate-sugar epimerase
MRIFMTGASGFVGGEVAARLVAAGHSLTALIRQSSTITANDGRPVDGVVRIKGDIAQPLFGMTPDDHARIAASHDLILHCAATVRFDLSDAEYHAINVGGANAAVALARTGNIPLLHVSTAYVCGRRDGTILEDEALPEGGWANGYESSKAAAERVVATSGVRHAIARPSIVVGDSRTGQVREFGAVYGLFKILAEGRFRRIPAHAGATLDFVPIDHVASGIAELAERIDEASGAYHLVSGAPIPLEAAVGLVAGVAKSQAPELIDPATFAVADLSTRERWIFDNVFGHYSSYVTRNPRFAAQRFQRFYQRPMPVIDIDYFHKLIQHAIDQRFVRAA